MIILLATYIVLMKKCSHNIFKKLNFKFMKIFEKLV